MFGLAKKSTGWIGIDVGTSHVKVAQVAREQQRWKLASSAIIPRTLAWKATESESNLSSAGELAAAASLSEDLRGRNAAATLPMAFCELHQSDEVVNFKGDRNSKLQQLIEAVSCQPATHLQCDAWPAERGKNGAPLKTNIIGVPRTLSDQLCLDLQQNGWSCQTIDGLPMALARAVSMSAPQVQQSVWAAIDLGFSRATFCVVQRRLPVYVRCLKGCGLRDILAEIQADLGIDHKESLKLLQEHDLGTAVSDSVEALVRKTIGKALSKLSFEIERTLSHVSCQRRTVIPEGAYLFGGGAGLKSIDAWLTEKTSFEHRVWSFGPNAPGQAEQFGQISHLLGPAIALSALAWEKR